jgi:hypothetical protein
MVEDMGLKIIARPLHTKFLEILPSGSKVSSGGETDRFDKPTFIFGK